MAARMLTHVMRCAESWQNQIQLPACDVLCAQVWSELDRPTSHQSGLEHESHIEAGQSFPANQVFLLCDAKVTLLAGV